MRVSFHLTRALARVQDDWGTRLGELVHYPCNAHISNPEPHQEAFFNFDRYYV